MSEELLNKKYVKKLEEMWDAEIKKDAKYWRENDAKLRAVNQVESYEEFRNIVLAAHLQPLRRKELVKMESKNKSWNTAIKQTIGTGVDACLKASAMNSIREMSSETTCSLFQSPAHFARQWQILENVSRIALLKNMTPIVLEQILKRETPSGFLGDISNLLQPSDNLEECVWQISILEVLPQSERFWLNMQFLTNAEKKSFQKLFENIESYNDKDIKTKLVVLREKFKFEEK